MLRPIRLLADDLTGALDSAAAFGTPEAPVPVVWRVDAAVPDGPCAVDGGTREADARDAAAIVRRLAPNLFAEPGALSYKKIDSLLRGSEAQEIAAVLETGRFERCVIAPAFPAQGRLTRGGRQGLRRPDGRWEALPVDLAATLEAAGIAVARAQPGEAVPAGVSVWDAESDADLDALVAAGASLPGLLWVGSGGLAGALARRFAQRHPSIPMPHRRPILGLFGTDHPVMAAQLAAVAAHHLPVETADHADAVAQRLHSHGAAFVSVALPPNTPRPDAAGRIADVLGGLAGRLDAPGTLVVAGGETLRGLCAALGTQRLDVVGELMPGIPASVLVGGRWGGTAVVSKSGAFGAPDLLDTLLAAEAALPVGA